MKIPFTIVMILGLFAGFANAQKAPAWEVFGGYHYAHGVDPWSGHANGFSAGLQQNVSHWFGGVADIDASFNNSAGIQSSLLTFTGGPQFTYRKGRDIQPFVRGLVGFATASSTHGPTDTGFAIGGGGGVDVRMSRSLYFRGKADFIRTSLFNSTEHYLQTAVGIAYRFGGNAVGMR